MYIIGAVLALLSGLGIWIYNLVLKNRDLKQKAASAAVLKQLQEWSDRISSVEEKVKVDERDYDKAKDDFNKSDSGK